MWRPVATRACWLDLFERAGVVNAPTRVLCIATADLALRKVADA